MVSRSSGFDLSRSGRYSLDRTLRELHEVVDGLPPARARGLAAALLFARCRSVLGKGDREEFLDEFFAEAQRSPLTSTAQKKPSRSEPGSGQVGGF
jgi:hypothetical protein